MTCVVLIHGRNQLRHCQARIYAVLRMCRMCLASNEFRHKATRGGGKCVVSRNYLVIRILRQVVETENHINMQTLEQSGLHYFFCAVAGLLLGLENQHDVAVGRILAYLFGKTHKNGRVSVVSAFVCNIHRTRAIGEWQCLVYRQGVDVGSESHGALGTRFFEHRHKAVAAHVFVHFGRVEMLQQRG